MFTGIIFKTGKLVSLLNKDFWQLTLQSDLPEEVKIGDSIAVNGTCLTLTESGGDKYTFNLSGETQKLSTFSDLSRGSELNLELALRMNDFLGGHLVNGHIDGTARVKAISKSKHSNKFNFVYQDRNWEKFIVLKGSIAINGISLTISEISGLSFSVEVIPHTLKSTNLKWLKVHERVNIELDLMGKYLYNLTLKYRK